MTRSRRINPEIREQQKLNLETLLEQTNAAGGEQMTKLEGTSARWPLDKIIRTGSLDFDMCTGIGGIPRGRITEVYGEFSSGKTTFFLHVVAEAQRQGLNVLYIDAENALDPIYCRRLGVDLELMLVNQPNSLQKAIDLMVAAMKNSMDANANDLLIVLDSIPALTPDEVMESSAEQQTRALAARYWSANMGKIVKLASDSRTTVLMINQLRDSMDMYKPASTPGGKAIKFGASLRIKLWREIDDKKNAAGSSGQTVNFDIEKNKVGSPFKKGSFYLPKNTHIDWASDVINSVIEWGGVVNVDQKFEGGNLVNKKGWYSFELAPGDLDLIRKDELENWLAFNTTPDADGTFPEEADFHTEENFQSAYADDAEIIQVYQYRNFVKEVTQYPSLIEVLEERLLETLNAGLPIDDIETAADPYDLKVPDEA